MELKMIVAGHNANGEPDFYFCKVRCTFEEYNEGEHYALATRKAEDEGYRRPFVSICEDDPAGKAMLPLFTWKDASEYTI